MKAFWTPRALRDVEEVLTFIAKDIPGAASDLADRILSVVEDVLLTQPMIGRPGRVAGTREYVVQPSYILAYRVTGDAIDILTFRHSARRWPDRL